MHRRGSNLDTSSELPLDSVEQCTSLQPYIEQVSSENAKEQKHLEEHQFTNFLGYYLCESDTCTKITKKSKTNTALVQGKNV